MSDQGIDRQGESLDDAEQIARLLDGRATPAERQRLLERADASPALLSLLADASAILEDKGIPSPSTSIADIGAARRRRLAIRAVASIAAVLVAAVAIPLALRQRTVVPSFSADEGLGAAQLVGPAYEGAPRATTRGTLAASRRELSPELGSRVTDYLVLSQASGAAAREVAFEIAASLRSVPGGGPAAAQFEALARSSNVADRFGAVTAAEQLLDTQRFRAGMWVELIRLAAAAQSEELLRRPDIVLTVARISRGAFSAQTQTIARRLHDELAAPTQPVASIQDEANALLRELRK
jgi:hypothetical protein